MNVLVHCAFLSHVLSISVELSSLLLSLLVYRRSKTRSIHYFLAVCAVLTVHAAADALRFYGKEIVGGGSHPSLAFVDRCFALIAAGFLGYMAFVFVQDRLRAPFARHKPLAGLKKAALSLAIILSPQMLLSSPHVRSGYASVRFDGGAAYALLAIAFASLLSFLVITGGGREDWFAKAMAVPSMSFAALAALDAVPWLRASARPFSISVFGCLSLGLWNVLLILRTYGAPFGRNRRPLGGETEPLRVPFEQCGVSKRESEILRCIAEGCSNKQIADRLFISLPTVKTHVYHIFRKFNVETRLELLRELQRLDPFSR